MIRCLLFCLNLILLTFSLLVSLFIPCESIFPINFSSYVILLAQYLSFFDDDFHMIGSLVRI